MNDKLIDMHTHTNYSDGDLSPMELIERAIKNNIGVLAITDHDTLEGIKSVDKNNSIIAHNPKLSSNLTISALPPFFSLPKRISFMSIFLRYL